MPKSSPSSEIFRKRLLEAREMRGLTQAELAKKAGLAPAAISHFETGARKPSFDNLRRLAGALRVSTDFLLGLVDEPSPDGPPGDPLYRKLAELTDEQRAFAEKILGDLGRLGRK